MGTGPDGRKRVDLSTLPVWAQALICAVTIAVVVIVALRFASDVDGPTVPISAIIAGLVAFGYVAWRAQHRR
jgi:hypothetical protein